jgi:thiol-disulfide isomerase/thioredoxin
MTKTVYTVAFVLGLCMIAQPVLISQQRSGTRGTRIEDLRESTLKDLVTHRKGKILILNFWATWCVPCVEEFPDLSRIADRYTAKGVEVVAVSIDTPEDLKTKVIPFVQGQSARIRYFLNAFEKDEQLIDAVSKDWSGAIPTTVLYNSTGQQSKFLVGKQTYSSLSREIYRMLTARHP